jgi:hypothetical protein
MSVWMDAGELTPNVVSRDWLREPTFVIDVFASMSQNEAFNVFGLFSLVTYTASF